MQMLKLGFGKYVSHVPRLTPQTPSLFTGSKLAPALRPHY